MMTSYIHFLASWFCSHSNLSLFHRIVDLLIVPLLFFEGRCVQSMDFLGVGVLRGPTLPCTQRLWGRRGSGHPPQKTLFWALRELSPPKWAPPGDTPGGGGAGHVPLQLLKITAPPPREGATPSIQCLAASSALVPFQLAAALPVPPSPPCPPLLVHRPPSWAAALTAAARQCGPRLRRPTKSQLPQPAIWNTPL